MDFIRSCLIFERKQTLSRPPTRARTTQKCCWFSPQVPAALPNNDPEVPNEQRSSAATLDTEEELATHAFLRIVTPNSPQSCQALTKFRRSQKPAFPDRYASNISNLRGSGDQNK
jgi:hypothetical protein